MDWWGTDDQKKVGERRKGETKVGGRECFDKRVKIQRGQIKIKSKTKL